MAKKMLYLDHNATTPLRPKARTAMMAAFDFAGNASAPHRLGREARRLIDQARAILLQSLNADARAVCVFTSGATEANNMVLRGSGVEQIFVSAIEHPSVLRAAPDARVLPVTAAGVIDLEALEQALKTIDRSTLISVMMVNNETGVIQPIAEVVTLARRYGALVHTDAVQAYGRMPIDLQALGVDYITLSSHKIGGPQGAGAIIMANCVSVAPLILGGSQEKGLRSGTENVAAISGFGAAIQAALEAEQNLSVLRDRIEAALPDACFFGREAPRIGNTTLFAVPGVPSENLLLALDLEGICVSNGSACASGTVRSSHVLAAMGVDPALAQGAVRISLGWDTTDHDIDLFIDSWRRVYGRISQRLREKA